LARLQRGKAKALEQKQTVDWRAVGRDWKDYFESGAAGDSWREEFLSVIEGVITDQGNAWNVSFGMQFNVRNLFAEEWFDDYVIDFAQDINKTTNDGLTEMLQQAMREGWTIDEMRKQIDLQFDRYTDPAFTLDGRRLTDEEQQWFADRSPRYRREMIARTETIKASNAGSIALFNDWGVVDRKEWLATGDNRTRATHLVAWANYSEGGTPGPIPLGAAFQVGSSSLMFPGDPRGAPEETINCRCVNLPWFSEAAGTLEQIQEQQAMIAAEQERRLVIDEIPLRGFEGTAFFSDIGTAIGRAEFGGDVAFNSEQYANLDQEGRTFVVAHEIAHQTVEPYVLRNMSEWDKAERALLILENERGKLFIGGNTRIGEAVSDGVAAMLARLRVGGVSDEKWDQVLNWATDATERAGFSTEMLRADIRRIREQLNAQL